MRSPKTYRPGLRQASPAWAVVIRSFAFVRKEVVEILRQPRLVALMVLGPFVLLLLFGAGYGETTIQKSAVFVADEGSIYDSVVARYEDDLSEYIESKGMVNSTDEARAMLDAGDVDVVVVFPDNPEQAVLAGEHAVITILHNELDPLQRQAIEIAARLAIQEVNATVLTTVAADAQEQIINVEQFAAELTALSPNVLDDPVAARDQARPLFDQLVRALNGSETVLGQMDGSDPARGEQLRTTRTAAEQLAQRLAAVDESTSDAELEQLAADVSTLAATVQDTLVLDPEILVRPFASDTESTLPNSVSSTEYFTPASLALLLQHLALTFAALSLVRDRRTGLFELMRVGPLSSIEIVIGKVLAYLLVGCFVGAALVAASVFGLGVPFAGSVAWMAIVIVGVLLASLGLGMMLAIVSNTESQAVQFAMLALLAGMFFSGFGLPLDSLQYPVKVISWLLPVTYGIEAFQDVMLAGRQPSRYTVFGLAGLVVVYCSVAIAGLRSRLRTSAG